VRDDVQRVDPPLAGQCRRDLPQRVAVELQVHDRHRPDQPGDEDVGIGYVRIDEQKRPGRHVLGRPRCGQWALCGTSFGGHFGVSVS